MTAKKSFKTLIALLCLLIVATIFSACSSNGDKKSETKTSTSAKSSDSSNSEDSDSSSSTSDKLGLCDIVSQDTIKTALGTAGATLNGPNSTGVQSLGDGDKGTTCIYPFEKNGTVSNAFYLDLAQYSKTSFDNIKDFTGTSGEDVANVGDSAKFQASEPITGGKEFTITAIKGTNVYLFVIALPDGSTTFDEASAKTALTTIAQAATLK